MMNSLLSSLEWNVLYEKVVGAVDLFTAPGSERDVFRFLVRKTLRFHKYSEWLSTGSFLNTSIQAGFIGLGYDRSTVYRARCSLRKRNVVLWKSTSDVRERIEHLLNMPEIVRVLVGLAGRDGTIQQLEVSRRKILDDYDGIDWYGPVDILLNEAVIMRMEEAMKNGVEKSEKAKRRRIDKRDSKTAKDASVGLVMALMREYCNDYGVPFYDEWTSRDKGSVRNWLKYCQDGGVDFKEILKDTCRLWPKFRAGVLTGPNGNSVVLPHAVSFLYFFKYRREVGAWIMAHKDDDEAVFKEEEKVVLRDEDDEDSLSMEW